MPPALHGNKIQLIRLNVGEIQSGAYRERGETRPVLDAAQSLLGDGEDHFAVAHNARRRIVHLRIVAPHAERQSLDHLSERVFVTLDEAPLVWPYLVISL